MVRFRRTSSRREFLSWSAFFLTAAACRSESPSGATPSANLSDLSAVDAVAAMRNGSLRAEDYAAALLERCEAGKALNAFITLEPEKVLEAARARDAAQRAGETLGPLHGLPIPIKDSVDTRDFPTTGGTPALRRFVPKEDAPIIKLLLDAGAIVLGKTNLHELSWGWTSNNFAFGAVHNPYDPTRIPGGSSGGTAAAVAARMAPLGLAEDTEGSIRVPAAMCGLAGFRPTTGRYPSSGVLPITPLFDQVGPHAREVADLVLFDAVASGDASPLEAVSLEGARLGVDRGYYFQSLDPEVERLTQQALSKLEDAGAVLVEVEVSDLAPLVAATTNPIQIHDVRPSLIAYLAEHDAGMTFDELLAAASEDIRTDFARYVVPGAELAVSDDAYREARDVHLPALRESFRTCFADHGLSAMVFPTTLVAALPIGEIGDVTIGSERLSFETAVSRNIAPGSTAGLPGLVLPVGLTTGGLPVSIELDGPAGGDRDLLALGLGAEAVLGHLPGPSPAPERATR